MIVHFVALALAAEPVALKFRWPEGVSFEVEAVRTRVSEVGGGQSARSTKGHYTESIARSGSKLLVSTSNAADDRGALGPLDGLALGAWPAWFVKKNGKFVGIGDAAGERAKLEPLLGTMESAMAQAIRDRMSDAALTDTVSADWDALVGRWRGRTLTPGETLADTGALDLPQISRPVRTVRTVTAERVPCDDRSCLKIIVDEVLDPVEHDAVLAAMNDGFRKDGRVAEVDVHYRWELVTEPDTLIPHAASSKRTLIVAVGDGSHTALVGQVDELTRRFTARLLDRAAPSPNGQ